MTRKTGGMTAPTQAIMLPADETGDTAPQCGHYATIAHAIRFMATAADDHPSLDTIAAAVNLSPWHFQRLFTSWVGISPKRFLQHLTLNHAKRLLTNAGSVLDVALDVGLSGPGRLHDLFVTYEAVTPGQYKLRGAGLNIAWGFHASPFGEVLVATTDRGVCWLGFVTRNAQETFHAFRDDWPAATLEEDCAHTAPLAEKAFSFQRGRPALPLHLRGTPFQLKVWEALLRIPEGTLVTYGDVAAATGSPRAVRAVGHAVGRNPIALLIPCHRVILKCGAIHNYRWESERKAALIAFEAARSEALKHAAANTGVPNAGSCHPGSRYNPSR